MGSKVAVARRVCDLFKNLFFFNVNENYEISKICSMVEISKIRMVSASCIWFEDAFLGPKVAVPMRVVDLSKKCTFFGGE